MRINPDKDIKVTTSVYVVQLPFTVALHLAYPLLPVSDLEEQGSAVGKILHLEYGDLRRPNCGGENNPYDTRRRKDKVFGFPNCVNMKVAVSEKNLNIKLCPQRLQMTGVKSRAQAEEGYALVCNHLEALQRDMDAARSKTDPDMARAVRLRMARVAGADDTEKFDEWMAELDENVIETLTPVESEALPEPGVPQSVMINKNYSIGGPLPLNELATSFERLGKTAGLNVMYNNCVQSNILLWIEDDALAEGERMASREQFKKRPIHRIFVNKTGMTTQMGPDEHSMNVVHRRFIDMLTRCAADVST